MTASTWTYIHKEEPGWVQQGGRRQDTGETHDSNHKENQDKPQKMSFKIKQETLDMKI